MNQSTPATDGQPAYRELPGDPDLVLPQLPPPHQDSRCRRLWRKGALPYMSPPTHFKFLDLGGGGLRGGKIAICGAAQLRGTVGKATFGNLVYLVCDRPRIHHRMVWQSRMLLYVRLSSEPSRQRRYSLASATRTTLISQPLKLDPLGAFVTNTPDEKTSRTALLP